MPNSQGPINPILAGIMDAMSMANMFHSQRMQNEQLALDKAREARQAQFQQNQESNQNADLAMRLNAVGARPMTPSDQLEAQTGQQIQFTPTQTEMQGYTPAAGGGVQGLPFQSPRLMPSVAPSDIANRLVKAGGQQYVLPSQTEREDMENRAASRDTAQAVAKTTATTKAKSDADIEGTKAKLAAFGVTVSDENAKLLGMAPGSRIMPEHMDDYMRAVASAKAAQMKGDTNIMHVGDPFWGSKGAFLPIVNKDGSVKVQPLNVGSKPAEPVRTEETPTDKRQRELQAQKQLTEEAASRYAGAYEDPEEAVKQLRTDTKDPKNQYAPFLQKNFISITKAIRSGAGKADPNSPDAVLKSLDKAMGNNGSSGNGGNSPKPQQQAAPAQPQQPASKGKANGDQIRAYATKFKLSFQQSVQQAKKEGYDVSGLEASGR